MILLGKQIKDLRTKYKLTQTELAEKVGVTKSTIAAYENNSRQPSYEVLIKMSRVFKVSIDSLLLNHPGATLEVHGLNVEQLQIVEILIAYFRKSNYLEDLLIDQAPNLVPLIKDCIDKRIDDIKDGEE